MSSSDFAPINSSLCFSVPVSFYFNTWHYLLNRRVVPLFIIRSYFSCRGRTLISTSSWQIRQTICPLLPTNWFTSIDPSFYLHFLSDTPETERKLWGCFSYKPIESGSNFFVRILLFPIRMDILVRDFSKKKQRKLL